MIFGQPVPFDDRYGIYMNDFFNLVNSANLTCDVTHNKKTYETVIQFNNYESETVYRNALEIKFGKAVIEFEKTTAEIINKQDKLRLITSLNGEFDSFTIFLNKNASGSFSHKFFEFKNLSQKKKDQNKILNESICQDYYLSMNNYLEKMGKFLKNSKEDIGLVSQLDFINHPSNLQDINASTKSNPLNFFVNLFSLNGLSSLRQDFISSFNKDQFTNANYNSITDIMSETYTDSETSETRVLEWSLNDYYSNRLNLEFQISRNYINQYINDQEQESLVIFFLKKTLTNLNSLLKVIENDSTIKKYEDSPKPIKDLIKYVDIKRSEYNNDKKQIIKNFKIKIGPYKVQKAQLLFNALSEGKYIHANSEKDFMNAFTEKEPKDKIIWTGRIGDLKTFINHSIKKGLIEENKSKWLTTAKIFTNDGIHFDHRYISASKVTLNKPEIEAIVNSIINSTLQ